VTTLPQASWNPADLAAAILAEALALAAAGVAVFPIHGLREVATPVVPGAVEVRTELRCTCGSAACPNVGKHPVGSLAPNGHKNATTELAQVAEWFKVRTDPASRWGWVPWNLGVATGNGLVVIDAEPRSNRPDLPTGLEVLDDWETWTAGTSIPLTKVIQSGSGGLHLWLSVDPNLRIKPRNRVLPNVDVKGDGGYVLAPPSCHVSGGTYQLLHDRSVAPVGEALRAWLLTVKGGRFIARRAAEGSLQAIPDDYDFNRILAGDGCPAGHRDYFVNDLCFRLRKSGASLDDAARALRAEWNRMERPAGDDFPWDTCLYKLRRVWEEVEPGEVVEIPAWRPPRGGSIGGTLGGSNEGDEDLNPQLTGEFHENNARVALETLNRPELTFNRTDTGNGIRFAQRMRDVVRYATGEDKWYLWDGLRWAPDKLNRTLLLTEEIIKDIFVEAATLPGAQRDQLEGWAQTSQSAARRHAMLEMAGVQEGIAIAPDDLDRDPWLLVLRNGTLDLRTATLRESSPSDLNTRLANVAYDPAATCPLWLQHMEFVTKGDKSLAWYIQRAIGYTLTGLTGEQKLFFLWGNGNNGKSTFVDVISNMLGDYATQADAGLLAGGSEHPTQLAGLRGARLVVADETEKGRKLREQRVKSITGGKKIKARFMRQDYFEFTPRFKLWITGNHKPEIEGADDGIWRRLKLVPFVAKFTADNRILDYDEILLGEANGILNWALEGLAAWRETNGLGENEVVLAATQEYRNEEDSIGLWLTERAEIGVKDAETDNGSLYENYRWWCHANGLTDVKSNIVLGRELAARGLLKAVVKRDGKTQRVWRGIKLQSSI
jgi:P4 family phage/plasmid primase-like protien